MSINNQYCVYCRGKLSLESKKQYHEKCFIEVSSFKIEKPIIPYFDRKRTHSMISENGTEHHLYTLEGLYSAEALEILGFGASEYTPIIDQLENNLLLVSITIIPLVPIENVCMITLAKFATGAEENIIAIPFLPSTMDNEDQMYVIPLAHPIYLKKDLRISARIKDTLSPIKITLEFWNTRLPSF